MTAPPRETGFADPQEFITVPHTVLWNCRDCGATVEEQYQARHIEWHVRMVKAGL